uniref:Class I-C chitinase n=1 Tax=Apopellia endiviifolia (species B) TaxID=119729 RepID=A0A6B7NQC9_9MARC|nr:class I-C chitinase [Apopellia endiviifolia (species B)]
MRSATLLKLALSATMALLQMYIVSSAACSKYMPCRNNQCCSSTGYCGSTSSYCGWGCQSGPCYTFNKEVVDNTDMSTMEEITVARLVTPNVFDNLFPSRNSFYSYQAFLNAASAFSAFGTTGSPVARKREIAAFLAHVQQESDGLSTMDTVDDSAEVYCCAEKMCMRVNNPAKGSFDCVPGKKYFARGPMHLTWNYNYGAASQEVGADLLAEPELLSNDAVLSFKSALWMWMNYSGATESMGPSAHEMMSGSWSPSASDEAAGRLRGFGATIDILKGSEECGHQSSQAEARTQKYIEIAKLLKVSPGPNLGCASMLPF